MAITASITSKHFLRRSLDMGFFLDTHLWRKREDGDDKGGSPLQCTPPKQGRTSILFRDIFSHHRKNNSNIRNEEVLRRVLLLAWQFFSFWFLPGTTVFFLTFPTLFCGRLMFFWVSVKYGAALFWDIFLCVCVCVSVLKHS